MKWVNKLALFCVVCAIVLRIGAVVFDRKIGGNADRGGYCNDGVYMVYDDVKEVYTHVSKPLWYINYVYTQIDMFFLYLGCVSVAYLLLEYIFKPLRNKLVELDRRYGR